MFFITYQQRLCLYCKPGNSKSSCRCLESLSAAKWQLNVLFLQPRRNNFLLLATMREWISEIIYWLTLSLVWITIFQRQAVTHLPLDKRHRKLAAMEHRVIKNTEQKCQRLKCVGSTLCSRIAAWALVFIQDEYLRRTMTLKRPILAASLGCKMGHLSHNRLWLQFPKKMLRTLDSKPVPSAFRQDSTLAWCKNTAFKGAAQCLINIRPEHFLWWMKVILLKLLLANLSQKCVKYFLYFS